jgi:methylene-fatty-acyl-phospholipid synthase
MFHLVSNYVEFNLEFWLSAFTIFICPITWNLVARFEFHTKYFSKLAGDNRLAADIFAHILIEMGIFRNYMYQRVLKEQPHFDIGYDNLIDVISYIMLAIGLILVFGAYYRLGIHGIYYADYFGILMKEKVTAFPYNATDNPMYGGSTLIFLSGALYNRAYCGFALTILALLMYVVASILENPMTELIYSEENIKATQKMNEEREKIMLENKSKKKEKRN